MDDKMDEDHRSKNVADIIYSNFYYVLSVLIPATRRKVPKSSLRNLSSSCDIGKRHIIRIFWQIFFKGFCWYPGNFAYSSYEDMDL